MIVDLGGVERRDRRGMMRRSSATVATFFTAESE
jgi:hypothetical protein